MPQLPAILAGDRTQQPAHTRLRPPPQIRPGDDVADLPQQLLQLSIPLGYLRHIAGPVVHNRELPSEPDRRTTTEGIEA